MKSTLEIPYLMCQIGINCQEQGSNILCDIGIMKSARGGEIEK